MKSVTFSDFEAFSGAVTDVDCSMMLVNPKHRTWIIHQVELPRTHIQLGRLGSGNFVEGQSWSDGYLFYLPLTDKCTYTANGKAIPTGSFVILEPGCEFAICTADEHDWCSIFVPKDAMVNHSSAGSFSDPAPGRCRISKANVDLARQFETSMSRLAAAAINNPDLEASPAASVAEKDLVRIAATALQSLQVVDRDRGGGRRQISRQEIIRRCRAHLEGLPNAPPSVSDLATAANVSERTLRTAFRDHYGIGPKQFLRLRQLDRVYRDLRTSSDAEHTVSGILLRHGVWEHGRFSSLYRQLFGEMPSATLRNRGR